MTESEAITHLQNISEIIPGYCRSEAFSVAIGALQKQVAIVPAAEEKRPWQQYKGGKCTCGNHVKQYDAFCKRCGQKLSWE